jgi:hypothetical protein
MEKQGDIFSTTNLIKMDRNVPIVASDFSEEFEDSDSEGIVLLTKDNALKVWQEHVDQKAPSYYRLPDDNWIVKSNQVVIGQWLPDFNNNESQGVEARLNSSVAWNDSDIIWFCISRALIIEASWYDFKRLWMNFLECEDDCPILLNSKKVGCALLFFPMGSITKVEVV